MDTQVITTEMLLPILYYPALILCFMIIYLIIVIIIEYNIYKKSIYFSETNSNFFKVIFNNGSAGEYKTSLEVEKIKDYKKILFNCYLIKENNKTTETDIIVITQKGIIAIENKNYSGAIYGSESDNMWTHTIGGKHKFYNPIKQNEGHINELKRYLPNVPESRFFSIIVFNNDCEFRKLKISQSVNVIKKRKLQDKLNQLMSPCSLFFTKDQVNEMYRKLKNFTNVSKDVKDKHAQSLKAR